MLCHWNSFSPCAAVRGLGKAIYFYHIPQVSDTTVEKMFADKDPMVYLLEVAEHFNQLSKREK